MGKDVVVRSAEAVPPPPRWEAEGEGEAVLPTPSSPQGVPVAQALGDALELAEAGRDGVKLPELVGLMLAEVVREAALE